MRNGSSAPLLSNPDQTQRMQRCESAASTNVDAVLCAVLHVDT